MSAGANYDFSNLSYIALDAILYNVAKNTDMWKAAEEARQKLSDANLTANQDFGRGYYQDRATAAASEDISNQTAFLLEEAKALAGFKGELTDVNGELIDGSELIYVYNTQLERMAISGKKCATALQNYKDALESGNISD